MPPIFEKFCVVIIASVVFSINVLGAADSFRKIVGLRQGSFSAIPIAFIILSGMVAIMSATLTGGNKLGATVSIKALVVAFSTDTPLPTNSVKVVTPLPTSATKDTP